MRGEGSPIIDTSRRIAFSEVDEARRFELLAREWLVTNGLGGYASGTIGGSPRRRYHGLLTAALPAPLGRRLVFPHSSERVRLPGGGIVALTAEAAPAGDSARARARAMQGTSGDPREAPIAGGRYLEEFRLELGLPVWRYALDDWVIEKRLLMPHEQNTTVVLYRMVQGPGTLRLKLRLAAHHKSHHDTVGTPLPGSFRLTEADARYELTIDDLPPLRFTLQGRRAAFTVERAVVGEFHYDLEAVRGYEADGALWTPGYFRADLTAADPVALVVSTESWSTACALSPGEMLATEQERRRVRLAAAPAAARSGLAGELVLAADQFLTRPVGRTADAALAQAGGTDVRTVIAGYHWFTDWGRDTMISLEGLTLATGRADEARDILHLFAGHIRDGLLPNLFPEGETEGLYHTADATLWFFHALDRYLRKTGDRTTLELLMPKLLKVVEHHERGTRFGIGVDAADHLLRQGEAGYQLTWMDAKVGDWVVTPRRGKAVEINALWHNALCLLTGWLDELGRAAEARRWAELAAATRASFNTRFWYTPGGYLYDVVDGEQGDDPACRPNQLLAISLDHPVLEPERWPSVLEVVRSRLLTPVGLRTLSPAHPGYRARYDGDIHSRDAAYHQGTVWPWLIGPFVDAWLKVHVDDLRGARGFLSAFDRHLNEDCIGTISEIFDAEPPYAPRGCVAQAWSVAEVLRALIETQRQQAARSTPS